MGEGRKARPKDPCPCGSGKKFKKCHGQRKRERERFHGRAAREAIISRLTNWPKAQVLATEVANFYGDYLQYHVNTAFTSSHYDIKLQHDPIALQYARIQLQLTTLRIAEALSHELLHLHIPMRGYPIGEKVSIPDELHQYADLIIDSYSKINNLLGHELNVEKFVNLGFEKTNFLGSHSRAPNYQHLATKASPCQGYIEEIGFFWWCLEYFRHWVSTRHGVGDEATRDARNALYWGSKVHPELTERARQIRELIECGEIKDHNQYPQQVNSLLQLMKIPKFTGWAAIQSHGYSKPVAIRLIDEDN